MSTRRFPSVTEQVAQVLRIGLQQGRWHQTMPGRIKLAAELGVNHKTVNAALQILENEGMLVSRGAGRERKIAGTGKFKPALLRVAILLYEPADRQMHYIIDLRHQLTEAGHTAAFALKTMRDLGMNVTRIARMVEQTEADAWVVVAGPRDVLEWFAAQATPAFALFGRMMQVPLAGTSPKKMGALHELEDRLVALGHRRIVMLVREDRRRPEPGFFERLFLDKLEACGIQTSAYNLPDWGDSPEELQRILNSLFRHTPPTALIIGDVLLFFAVQLHLARQGILAPDHVSLACTDSNPSFDWCRPSIAHIDWEFRPLINRVVNWANNVSRGKDDRRKSTTKARLVIGGTIGPANG
jgi:DNA-binding LacI/PurR family transcriptional regulator